MKFDSITIFPELFDSFSQESLLKRAQKRGLLSVQAHNLRNWTDDAHNTVDEKPFGGGLGMVMKVKPIWRAVQKLRGRRKKNVKVILLGPRGKKFTQKKAHEYAKLNQLIMICGRYEGVDERVAKHIADEEISIGDYVLMGGEAAAMVVIEATARLIPGVVGKPEFLKERSQKKGFLEYPEYTRPEVFELNGIKRRVPKVLLSGDHKKIEEWKKKHGKVIE